MTGRKRTNQSWFAVDSGIFDHPKFVGLSPAAIALWFEGLAWSTRNQTDGALPIRVVERFATWPKRSPRVHPLDELIDANLWITCPQVVDNSVDNGGGEHELDAYSTRTRRVDDTKPTRSRREADTNATRSLQIHDFIDWQTPAEQQRANRDKTAERQRKRRERQTLETTQQPPEYEQHSRNVTRDSAVTGRVELELELEQENNNTRASEEPGPRALRLANQAAATIAANRTNLTNPTRWINQTETHLAPKAQQLINTTPNAPDSILTTELITGRPSPHKRYWTTP